MRGMLVSAGRENQKIEQCIRVHVRTYSYSFYSQTLGARVVVSCWVPSLAAAAVKKGSRIAIGCCAVCWSPRNITGCGISDGPTAIIAPQTQVLLA